MTSTQIKYVEATPNPQRGRLLYNSGKVGMNWRHDTAMFSKAGLDAETTIDDAPDAREPVRLRPALRPLAGASNYKNLDENGNISAYAFRTARSSSSGLWKR